jgi:hypothetical protein
MFVIFTICNTYKRKYAGVNMFSVTYRNLTTPDDGRYGPKHVVFLQ